MDEKKFMISKMNYILIAIALGVIVLGFLLMTGEPSGEIYNPDIFSTRRIVVGPMIAFAGFIFMIVAILYKPISKVQE